jgi:hypothetical protein
VTINSTAELSRKHFDDPVISFGIAAFLSKPAWRLGDRTSDNLQHGEE